MMKLSMKLAPIKRKFRKHPKHLQVVIKINAYARYVLVGMCCGCTNRYVNDENNLIFFIISRRHRCTHDTTNDKITTMSTDQNYSEVTSAYKTDFDKKTTDISQIRTEIKRPIDNLRPEGEFERPEIPKYHSVERPTQVRPHDNLRPEGDFFTPEKPKFQPAEKSIAIKPHDNLIISSGDFYGIKNFFDI